MAIDADRLLTDMLDAAAQAAGKRWTKLKKDATSQLETLAALASEIEARKLAGTIEEDEAEMLVKVQANAARAVFAGIKGQAKLAAEAAINAALAVLRQSVRAATGFPLP